MLYKSGFELIKKRKEEKMQFDFESVVNRSGHDALAIDGLYYLNMPEPKEGFDKIPMWVADMNFACPACITDAVKARLDHPFFGHFEPRQELYDGIIRWQKERNNVVCEKQDISFDTGVLGGVTSALNVHCQKGDKVLVHSATYIGFSGVFENNGYNPVLSELKKDENGVWRMDFEDMENKLKSQHIPAMVFCSPHNPTGRVWEQWELEKLSALCEKYSVEVISDEIWSDIIMPGFKHIPTQSATPYLHEHTVACYAPSKTFNLAGLTESYRIVYNKKLRDRVNKESSLSHYNELNMLSMYAHIGACSDEGHEWINQLCKVLGSNVDYAYDFINANFKGLTLSKPQGTYLLYVDATEYCKNSGRSLDEVLKSAWDVGVYIQDGRPFHGSCHIRMNLALPHSKIVEAFDRMKKYVFI